MRLDSELVQKINSSKYVLGVTGSMSCGKSYACDQLEQIAKDSNIQVYKVNFDLMRRDILGTNPKYESARQSLEDVFGPQIRKSDNSIDRTILSQLIYYDSNAMAQYGAQLAPHLKQYLDCELTDRSGIILVEWALLVEDQLLDLVNYNVLLVTCTHNAQMNRLKDGDLSQNEIKKRIAAQLTNEQKRSEILLQQKEAQKNGMNGELHLFDTTNDPSTPNYESLFGKILSKVA
ncbi:dephospho-CoA kinase [Candidatus Woesearchaeota archaeon]|jgi:dephospho-CoA kinase|nr:dephospho-CoA kinase [Candidatus Woesearchaeota archaeon]